MALTDARREVTNVDRKGKHLKAVWFADTAHDMYEGYRRVQGRGERIPVYSASSTDDLEDFVPSRYGPSREYLCNAFSVENADAIVATWNERIRAEAARDRLIDG